MVTFGILYIDVVGLLGSWRWLSVAVILISFLWAVLLLAVPDSPAFLVSQRRYEDARKALQVINSERKYGNWLICKTK